MIKNLISAQQFTSRQELEGFFLEANKLKVQKSQALNDKIVACLFYEPSTRTRFSFEAASLKLGGQVISSENAAISSSSTKGEIIEDTVKIVSNYADLIIIRHPESGICQRAAIASTVPIINAGDGSNEHPSQAMLDLYTINEKFGKIDSLKIALVGDLLYGRTVHSLIYLLNLYGNIELFLISPNQLRIPSMYTKLLKNKKIKFNELNTLDEVLPELDVLYMTRVQKERFSSEKEYKKYKNLYRIDQKALERFKLSSIIMHPLPRVNEIDLEVDEDKRACYFTQAQNGLYIRMAILKKLI